MSNHLPARSRLASASSASRPSPLLKSPSTPLEVYRLQHRGELQPSSSSSSGNNNNKNTGTPRPSVFIEHESPNSFASYRRNAGFGSPGANAIRSPARLHHRPSTTESPGRAGTASRNGGGGTGKRFVRRKPWKQRLQELPYVWYDQVMFSEYVDLANPAIGYPVGAALHLLSLVVMTIHPDGALHYRSGGLRADRRRTSSLFADQSGLGAIRRSQQESAWRFTANLLMFAVVVGVLTSAYKLLTARRRYHLWLKPVGEQLASENASLVGLPDELGATHQKAWYESAAEVAHGAAHGVLHSVLWLLKRMLYRIRLIRYVGAVVRFFFPASSGPRPSDRRSRRPSEPQMHALDVWQAPEVPLRIFTVYSPLHLLFYLYNLRTATATSTLSSGARMSGLFTGVVLMALISVQNTALVYLYTGLIRDKALIAAEVMNEYNQKFVMPRAMPVCRDASTMTSQSEMIGPEDLLDNGQAERTSNGTAAKVKKGRSTAGRGRG